MSLRARVEQDVKTIGWLALGALLAGLGGMTCTPPCQAQAVDGQVVRAERGDGVYSLLRRHGLSGEDMFEAFIELNRGKLGPNRTLYVGCDYRLPRPAQVVREPLFGTRYQEVRLRDRRLAGAAFYLVSGHGGPDPGGVAELDGHTLCEDEYAYDVVLRLGRRLLEHGARVHFIIRDPDDGIRDAPYLKPDKDERCYPAQPIPLNTRARLAQRARAVNDLYARDTDATYRRCLEIHVDARRKREAIDIFFYHHESSRLGKRLAVTLLETVREKYRAHQPGRGYAGTVSSRDLFMLRETRPPLVFIELGNIHHARDQQRLIQPENRQAIANWLGDGILRDFERSATPGR